MSEGVSIITGASTTKHQGRDPFDGLEDNGYRLTRL